MAKEIYDISDMIEVIRYEKQIFVADELKQLRKAGSLRGELTARVASRTYRKFRPRDISGKMKDTRLFSPLYITGDDNNKNVAEAANFAYAIVKAQALKHKDSGELYNNIEMFSRTVGKKNRKIIRTGRAQESKLKGRAIVEIVGVTRYAAALEAYIHRKQGEGILYHAAKMTKRKYGKVVAVRYDYVASQKLGVGGGVTFPRISIGNYGNARALTRKPGRSSKRNES